MSRSNRSARDAGTRFERSVADYLARALGDDRIDRRAKRGAKDMGDIAGARMHGREVVIECKDYGGRLELPGWLDEAERERGNADAAYGVVVAKRRGVADPAGQYVVMTLETFAAMMAGGPELLEGEEDGVQGD